MENSGPKTSSLWKLWLGLALWIGALFLPLDRIFPPVDQVFLFAPLVLIPLGLRLFAPATRLGDIAREGLLPAVLLVLLAVTRPRGIFPAAITIPWLLCALLATLDGAAGFLKRKTSVGEFAAQAGWMVGAYMLTMSRAGRVPLGFAEPWVLLTAMHFHFAAFIVPLLAAKSAARNSARITLIELIAVAGSPLVAIGFVNQWPAVRAFGALLLAIAAAIVSIRMLRSPAPPRAKICFGISAACGLVGFFFALWFASFDLFQITGPSLPLMAHTHGVLQAFGFSLFGLLAFQSLETIAAKTS